MVNDHQRQHELGMSFIEIIMVIAVIGTMFVVMIPNLGVVGTTEAASKIATLIGDIRATFDQAVLEGRPYRMVFDFNSGDYWLEVSDRTNFLIPSEKLERELSPDDLEIQKEEFEEQKELYTQLAGKEFTDEDGEVTIPPTSPLLQAYDRLMPAKWTKVEDIEWVGRSLGPYYAIQDMQTEHHSRLVRLQEYQDAAIAYLYFFPKGYVEKAVIHIGAKLGEYEIDPNEQPFTVTTKPYEGLAEFQTGYIEVNVLDED